MLVLNIIYKPFIIAVVGGVVVVVVVTGSWSADASLAIAVAVAECYRRCCRRSCSRMRMHVGRKQFNNGVSVYGTHETVGASDYPALLSRRARLHAHSLCDTHSMNGSRRRVCFYAATTTFAVRRWPTTLRRGPPNRTKKGDDRCDL